VTTDETPIVLMRGGTSKGVFIHERHLPPAGDARDAALRRLMGSPDPMQIDGLGGTHSSTSKVVVVGHPEADGTVPYRVAQVGIEHPIVDWSSNCGNLTTAVGPFAITEKLVPAVEPHTWVELRNENTGVRVRACVEVRDGHVVERGSLAIAGVPGTGAPVVTEYLDPGGAVLASALPTGAALQLVATAAGPVRASIVDVTNPYAFVPVDDLDVAVDLLESTTATLNADRDLLGLFENVRAACAVAVGVVATASDAATAAPVTPRLILVGRATSPSSHVRVMAVSLGRVHHALPMTAAMCLAAALRIDGTVPQLLGRPVPTSADEAIHIDHPRGTAAATSNVEWHHGVVHVASTGVTRTARRLLSGLANVEAVGEGSPSQRFDRVPTEDR
jgi:2-methylaconitate cis-trans-isomerase PrpF